MDSLLMDIYSSLIDNIKMRCDWQHLKNTPVLTGGFEAANASVSSLCFYSLDFWNMARAKTLFLLLVS